MGNIALGITTDAADQKVAIASTGSNTVTTARKHGLCAGDAVVFTGPGTKNDAFAASRVAATGVVRDQRYFVASTGLTDTAFKLSTSYANAIAGTTITIATADFDGIFAIPYRTREQTASNLDTTVSSGTTSVVASNCSNLPAAPFVAWIDGNRSEDSEVGEIVLVTANPGTDPGTLTVVRGFEGSKIGAHTVGVTAIPRKIYARSLAPSACAMADFDAVEALIRATSEVNRPTDDNYNGRANTLRSVTGSSASDELTTGSAHGMVAGDRFVFVTKTGGSNVRLGHTYYVTSVAGGTDKIKFCEERLHSSGDPYHGSATATANITLADAITAGYIRRLTTGGPSADITLTTSSASDDIIDTSGAHGLSAGDEVRFTALTGGSGLSTGRSYYVSSTSLAATTFRVADSSSTLTSPLGFTTNITAGTVVKQPTRTLGVTNSFYPRLWGWGSNVGTLRDDVITSVLHLRAVIDRGSQNIIHHTTGCDNWDPASIKHTYQELTFRDTPSGTFKLSVDGVETASITYNATHAADGRLADTIYAALDTAPFRAFLSNLRVQKVSKERATVPIYKVSFNGARNGIKVSQDLTGNGTVTVGAASWLMKPTARNTVAERWERQGAQIALVSPAKVLFRMNFEFEKKWMAHTSIPLNLRQIDRRWRYVSDQQQQAWDCWGDAAQTANQHDSPDAIDETLWKLQWQKARDSMVVTSGASNVKMVWCPHTATAPGVMAAWPGNSYVDYTGWDYYVKVPPETQQKTKTRLENNADFLRTGKGSSKDIVIGEFGFVANRSNQSESLRSIPIADHDYAGVYGATVEAGGYGEDPPNNARPPAGSTVRAPNFRWWLQRLYDAKASTPLGHVVGAVYWDRDLGGGTEDYRLQSGNSLISAFAGEILKPKTRTLVP